MATAHLVESYEIMKIDPVTGVMSRDPLLNQFFQTEEEAVIMMMSQQHSPNKPLFPQVVVKTYQWI